MTRIVELYVAVNDNKKSKYIFEKLLNCTGAFIRIRSSKTYLTKKNE